MKKLFFFITILSLVACTMSFNKKEDSLIKDEITKVLFHADSYDPVETILDSAFSPNDDPALFEKMEKFAQLAEELESLEDKASNYRSTISIWSGPYVDAYGKNEKAEAQTKLDKTNNEIERLSSKVQKVADEIKLMINSEKQFIGYKANHSYRGKNNAGSIVFGHTFFLFDEKMEKVLFFCDKEEYDQVQEAIEIIKERIEE